MCSLYSNIFFLVVMSFATALFFPAEVAGGLHFDSSADTLLGSSKNKNPVSKVLKIVISGGPASGKGTQCEALVKRYGLVHLSTGNMLRAAVKQQTEWGIKVRPFMDSGSFVPDDLMVGTTLSRLSCEDCTRQGWILDGFPRTHKQALALDSAGFSPDCVLFLDVPFHELKKRIIGRRIDPCSGKSYNIFGNPPIDAKTADKLIQRDDDTISKIESRYDDFQHLTVPILEHYSKLNRLITVDGNIEIDAVTAALVESIENHR
jgi:adenylate kinase